MRNTIIEAIIAALEPRDFVLALWQGGSAAHGYTDEWSDIDLQVIVEDAQVQETFSIVEKALSTLVKIKFKFIVPEPTWHGHSQCFYQLEGVSPFLMIDFVVMKHSHPNRFLEVERHGKVVIAFDKGNLVIPPPVNRNEHFLKMQERLEQLKMTFDFLQILVKKEINREHWVDAVSNYHAWTLQPLVEIINIVYRPDRYDFKVKYFSRDLPPEVVARVEPLYKVLDLAELAKKQQLAEAIFAETLPLAEKRIQGFSINN
jgi:predicted nucleotidyltransferase